MSTSMRVVCACSDCSENVLVERLGTNAQGTWGLVVPNGWSVEVRLRAIPTMRFWCPKHYVHGSEVSHA